MKLPATLSVQLVAPTGSGADLSDLLVSVDICIEGRYYYGAHVGLTDSSGRASVSGAALGARFESDRQTFMMDYKVPLEDCDARVRLHIEGGHQFAARRDTALKAPLVTAKAREEWRKARNPSFRSAEAFIALDTAHQIAETTLAAVPVSGT